MDINEHIWGLGGQQKSGDLGGQHNSLESKEYSWSHSVATLMSGGVALCCWNFPNAQRLVQRIGKMLRRVHRQRLS